MPLTPRAEKILKQLEWSELNLDLIMSFFIEFANFEYKMVNRGFFFQKPTTEIIKPNWDRFEDVFYELHQHAAEKICRDNWTLITEDFPRKLYARVYGPTFEDVESITEAARDRRNRGNANISPSDFKAITYYLKTVRNNLYHGAKCHDSATDIAEKVQNAIRVLGALYEALDQHDDIRDRPTTQRRRRNSTTPD